ncbi:hypothetical protein ACFU0X_10155 [Streptomyces cellulosae]|uniref:Uncharacterized protein n=1 Tax=Streptomyces cellulosae TaxID=1968 RepID=A0ABW6JDF2_STRCE
MTTTTLLDVAPAAYRASVTYYDGTTKEVEMSAAQADALIDTDLLDLAGGGDVKVMPDLATGRITVVRWCTGPRSATDSEPVTASMTVELEPLHVPKPTPTQYRSLRIVLDDEGRTYGPKLCDGRVVAGLAAIPPSVTRLLFARGWLRLEPYEEDGVPVERVVVSYAGRVAMSRFEHRTSTSCGSTDYDRGDGVALHGGWTSKAWCSCRQWRCHVPADRQTVQRAARGHREACLRAVFGLESGPGTIPVDVGAVGV